MAPNAGATGRGTVLASANPIGETIPMRKGLLGSLLVFLGGAPLVSAQGYAQYPPAYYAQMPQAWPVPQAAYPYGYPQGYAQPVYPTFRSRAVPNWPAAYPMPPQGMALSAY